jgi:hypothetical protein
VTADSGDPPASPAQAEGDVGPSAAGFIGPVLLSLITSVRVSSRRVIASGQHGATAAAAEQSATAAADPQGAAAAPEDD